MLNEKTLQQLRALTDFPALVAYLRDALDWPIDFDTIDDLADMTFDYTADELGLDAKHAVKIEHIRQIRNLENDQPWGIFYIEFEARRLPVMVLRRILNALVRANVHRRAWDMQDLLFICVQGEPGARGVSFAHFRKADTPHDEGQGARTAELRTFSWDSRETHFYYLTRLNLDRLRWPLEPRNHAVWREQWRSAFTQPHRETIRTAEKLSSAMAAHAVVIRDLAGDLFRLETEQGALHRIYDRFREALLRELSADAFADMIAQTVTYGLFSAAEQGQGVLTYGSVVEMIPATNPFLKDLLRTLIDEGGIDLAELGVDDLIDMLAAADVPAITHDFMRQTGSGAEDPVIHFYEQFLNEYDRKQRVERGVFYTPDPVVAYIVRAVDSLLKSEFGLADGLASDATHPESGEPLVQILDPATGTGTFLAHVIDLIAHARKAGNTPAWNEYVTRSLLPRLNGFELMMAPYTIAHMKLGLKLQQTGFDVRASSERLRVYLTNALEEGTAFEEQAHKEGFNFIGRESGAAAEVKRQRPIMVVLGNPPYSGASANNGDWIRSLVHDYYFVDGQPLGERNSKWLQDDYVKFIRFGQWRIEQNGEGILAFITNHGYLDNPTFRGMRQHLMQTFDDIYVIDLHGNSKKKEHAPGGGKDENVFDIQQGVAIGIFVKHARSNGEAKAPARVHHRHLWGKREAKYATLLKMGMSEWTELTPQTPFYFFVEQNTDQIEEYNVGFSLVSMIPTNSVGIVTGQDSRTIAFSQHDAEMLAVEHGLRIDCVNPIAYRPFDKRFVTYHEKVVTRSRTAIMRNMVVDNLAIISARQQSQQTVWSLVGITNQIAESCVISSNTREINYVFPLYLYPSASELLDSSDWPLSAKGRRPNLSATFVHAVERALGLTFITEGRGDLQRTFGPEDVFHYAYAVFHSPGYRARYAEFLKIDFPRLPLTSDVVLFRELVARGAALVKWHLLEDVKPVPPMDGRDPFAVVSEQGMLGSAFASTPLPMQAYLAAQPEPITPPTYPRFVAGANGSTVGTMRESDAYEGGRVYLDTRLKARGSYFEGVPPKVWAFRVGGYQVCHKWLYDRRAIGDVPGRTLSESDIAHYQGIVVALAETIRLMSEIDAVIESHGGWPLAVAHAPGMTETDHDKQTDQDENLMSDIDDIQALQDIDEDTDLDMDVVEAYEQSEGGISIEYDAPDDTEPKDLDSDDETILNPFNPKEINISSSQAVVEGLKRRMENNEIDLAPAFQRQAGIWSVQAQSRLIESLMIRVPIPAFYFDATDEDKWLVIDGLQRLTTLNRFMIQKSLRLVGLEFLKDHEGKTYDELPRALQRRIEESQVTIYVVQRGTPSNVKFNIFKRINTGGLPLSAQEIRHALNQGKASVLLEELANTDEFRIATSNGVRDTRMAARESALRFLAFILTRSEDYRSPDLDSFLHERMAQINSLSDAEIETLRARFKRAMVRSAVVLEEFAFRKVFKGGRRGPVSKALFESWSVNLDALTDEQITILIRRRKSLLNAYISLISNDEDFNKAISYSTGDPKRVRERFEKIREIIDRILGIRE